MSQTQERIVKLADRLREHEAAYTTRYITLKNWKNEFWKDEHKNCWLLLSSLHWLIKIFLMCSNTSVDCKGEHVWWMFLDVWWMFLDQYAV